MAEYTRISDDVIEPGDPVTSVLVQLLRDNALAVAGKRLLVFLSSETLVVTDQQADVGMLAGCIGGGATGGTGGAATAGGGGGGGGFVLKEIQPADLNSGDEIAVTVGGAGAASSFGGFCTAAAGAPGADGGAGGNGGAGGTGSSNSGAGPHLPAAGGSGGNGSASAAGTGGVPPLFAAYGRGGSGGFGNGIPGNSGGGGIVFVLY